MKRSLITPFALLLVVSLTFICFTLDVDDDDQHSSINLSTVEDMPLRSDFELNLITSEPEDEIYYYIYEVKSQTDDLVSKYRLGFSFDGDVATLHNFENLLDNNGNIIFIVPDSVTDQTGQEYSIIKLNKIFSDKNKCLSSVYLSSAVKSLEKQEFRNQAALTHIDLNGVESIGTGAFQKSGILKLHIPNSVTILSSQAFAQMTSLTSISFDIDSSLTTIPKSCFNGCTSLSNISLPDSIRNIGGTAFSKTNLSNLDLSNLTTSADLPLVIDNLAFSGISTNVTITLPKHISLSGSLGSGNVTCLLPDTELATFPSYIQTDDIEFKVTLSDFWKNNNYSAYLTFKEKFPSSKFMLLDDNDDEIKMIISDDVLERFLSADASVTIPNTVKTIGAAAFQNCNNLSTVTFAEGSIIETIGNSAFKSSGYTAGKTVCIPLNHLINLGSDLIESSSKIEFTGQLPDNSNVSTLSIGGIKFICEMSSENKFNLLFALGDLSNAELTIPENVAKIGSAFVGTGIKSISLSVDIPLDYGVFRYCKQLVSVSFTGSGSISIPSNAFSQCVSLTTIDFGDVSDLKIYSKAFQDCKALENITLPHLSTLSAEAFDRCTSLNAIKIPDSSDFKVVNGLVLSKSEGSSEFDSIRLRPANLVDIIIPASVTSLQSGAVPLFKGSNISSVTFSEGCNLEIKSEDFYNCTKLNSLIFKDGCTISSIGDRAFANAGLYTFNLPDSVKSIGANAFNGCLSLTTINISENSALNSIGANAFNGCNVLAEFFIPAKLDAIGEDAFYDCIALSKFEISANNTKFTFNNGMLVESNSVIRYVVSTVSTITIPDEISSYSPNAFYKNRLDNIIVPESHNQYASDGVSLMNKSKTELLLVGGGVVNLTIPESITQISSSSLVYATSLKSISWTGSDLVISSNAISSNSNLEAISFKAEKSLTLKNHAISECRNLTSIILECNTLVLNGNEQISNCGYNDLAVKLDYATIDSSKYSGHLFNNCNGLTTLISTSNLPDNSFYGTYHNFEAIINNESKYALEIITGQSIVIDGLDSLTGFNFDINTIKVSDSTSFRFTFTTEEGHTIYDVIAVAYSDGTADTSITLEKVDGMYEATLPASIPQNIKIVVSPIATGEKVQITLNPMNDSLSSASFEIIKGTTILPSIFETQISVNNYQVDDYQLVGWYFDEFYNAKYNQSPIESSITLFAKWSPTAGTSITFGNFHGLFDATYSLSNSTARLASGETVNPGGTISITLAPYDGFEFLEWKVTTESNGNTNITKHTTNELSHNVGTDATHIHIEVIYRYYSTSNSLINIVDIDKSPIYGEDIHQIWTWHSGNVNTTMGVWTGFPSIPLIVDDYVFVRANDDLIKLDISSGAEIKKITIPSTTVNAYYHYLGYGGGLIIDYATHTLYNLNLESVCTLDKNYSAAFYNDSYFYATYDNKLWKVDPTSGMSCTDDAWSSGIEIRWHSIYGTTSTPVFINDRIYFIEINGSDRLIASIDLNSGNKSTIALSKLSGLLIDDGWLTHYEYSGVDYLFVTGYSAGLFDNGTGKTATISCVSLTPDGDFIQDSEKYITIPDLTGTASAFVVYNGRGYVNVTGDSTTSGATAQFYVYDVNGFLSDPTSSQEWDTQKAKDAHETYLIYQEDSIKSHGSIVLNIAHAADTGKVYIYLLPYDANDQAVYIFEDHPGKNSASQYFVTSKCGASYGSQAVRVGPSGELIWYTDSGRLYCYGTEDLNAYYFMTQFEGGNKWLKVNETSMSQALESIDGYTIDSVGNITFNGVSQKISYYYNGWKTASQALSTFDMFHYFILSDDIPDFTQPYFYDSEGQIESCTVSDILANKSLVGIQLYLDLFKITEKVDVTGKSIKFKIEISKQLSGLTDHDWVISAHVKYADDTAIYIASPVVINDSASVQVSSASSGTPYEYLICIWDQDPDNDNAILYSKKIGSISDGDGN